MNSTPVSSAQSKTRTAAQVILWLLLFWSAMQLGGGFYEKQAVIPLWAGEVNPQTLGDSLAESGHTGSATRFWPFISPVVFLLAIINLLVAWRHQGPARSWWLTGSTIFVLMSVFTYVYFVPNMLSFMHRSDQYTEAELMAKVSLWLTLSPLRMLIAIPAWFACMRAATLMGGQETASTPEGTPTGGE